MRIIDLSSDVCSSVLEAVHAVIVLEAGETLGEDEFRRWCRARLAGFKTPKSMEIVAALPRNPAGKVLRRAIRERMAEIGRAHVRTPVTNAHLVCRLLLEKNKKTNPTIHHHQVTTLQYYVYLITLTLRIIKATVDRRMHGSTDT